MWVKEILGRAIEDEILSKPLRQRFKFRVEVNGVDRKEASSNNPVLMGFCFLVNHQVLKT